MFRFSYLKVTGDHKSTVCFGGVVGVISLAGVDKEEEIRDSQNR